MRSAVNESGTGGLGFCAPSPDVLGDGLWRGDVACSRLWWADVACPMAWTLCVPQITKLYFKTPIPCLIVKGQIKIDRKNNRRVQA